MAQSTKVGTFDPREVQLIVGGQTITGYADGAFINVERANDSWNTTVGANGEVMRARSVDTSGTIIVTLLMGSDSNDTLSNFFLADEKTGKAAFPVLMKNTSGREVASGSVAFIQKPASMGFSKDVETREWTIFVAHLEVFIGGTGDITP